MTTDDIDWGLMAHHAAVAHLNACWEALDQEQADPEDETAWDGIDLAGPFDGCDECAVREVLHAAWPIFERSQAGPSGSAGVSEGPAV